MHLRTAADYEELFKMKIMDNYLQNNPVSLVEWRNLLLQENHDCQQEIELAYTNVKRELLGLKKEQ